MGTDNDIEMNEHSIYTGTLPLAAEDAANKEDEADEMMKATEKKKYHSNAMYAASQWHNTVSYVKPHSNRGLDL